MKHICSQKRIYRLDSSPFLKRNDAMMKKPTNIAIQVISREAMVQPSGSSLSPLLSWHLVFKNSKYMMACYIYNDIINGKNVQLHKDTPTNWVNRYSPNTSTTSDDSISYELRYKNTKNFLRIF